MTLPIACHYQSSPLQHDNNRTKIGSFYKIRINNISKLEDSSVSEWIIKKGREIWLQRYEKTHNSDSNTISRLEKETLSQVRKLYDSCIYCRPSNDRELFSIPIEDFIKQPWQNLQTWVTTASPTVTACIKAQNERLMSQQRQLKDYFNLSDSNFMHSSQENSTIISEITTDHETSNNDIETQSTSHNTTNIRSRFPLPASEI